MTQSWVSAKIVETFSIIHDSKILVNALGQHTLADVKQVENSETNEVIAYWVRSLVLLSTVSRNGGTNINFALPCPVAVEQEYSVRADSIVSILTPSEQVAEAYNQAGLS